MEENDTGVNNMKCELCESECEDEKLMLDDMNVCIDCYEEAKHEWADSNPCLAWNYNNHACGCKAVIGEQKMKIKEFITNECENCNKELKTNKQFKKCFNRNHKMRIAGQFSIPVKETIPDRQIGIALTNAKEGEIAKVKIKWFQ